MGIDDLQARLDAIHDQADVSLQATRGAMESSEALRASSEELRELSRRARERRSRGRPAARIHTLEGSLDVHGSVDDVLRRVDGARFESSVLLFRLRTGGDVWVSPARVLRIDELGEGVAA